MKRLLVIGRATNSYTRYFLQQGQLAITYDCIEDIEHEGVLCYIARRAGDNFDGVLGISELATTIANVIATANGCNAPTAAAVLACQNKYISRQAQAQCVPHHTPRYALLHQAEHFPVFVKPARGSLSAFAQVIQTPQELARHVAKNAPLVKVDNALYKQILSLGHFAHKDLDTYKDFLCEEVVDGTQVCVDGYMFNGRVHIFGTTRAHLLEGTLSFSRWDFPVHIDGVDELVSKLVTGIGLNNCGFNVELMVGGQNIYVIEIHARPSTQFAWHIEQVTGHSPLQDTCLIALRQEPVAHSKQQTHELASCFVLRKKNDALVTSVPTQFEIEAIERTYPGVEIVVLVKKGKRLSDYRQDSDTFRYCLINAAGASIEELEKAKKEIEVQLKFKFA